LVQSRRRGLHRFAERDMNLHVPASHMALDCLAQGSFERVELGRQVEVQVQRAVIDALRAQHDLPFGNRLSYPGEARHALNAHWSTMASNSINCRLCSR